MGAKQEPRSSAASGPGTPGEHAATPNPPPCLHNIRLGRRTAGPGATCCLRVVAIPPSLQKIPQLKAVPAAAIAAAALAATAAAAAPRTTAPHGTLAASCRRRRAGPRLCLPPHIASPLLLPPFPAAAVPLAALRSPLLRRQHQQSHMGRTRGTPRHRCAAAEDHPSVETPPAASATDAARRRSTMPVPCRGHDSPNGGGRTRSVTGFSSAPQVVPSCCTGAAADCHDAAWRSAPCRGRLPRAEPRHCRRCCSPPLQQYLLQGPP